MKRYLWLYIGCFLSVILLSSLECQGYRERAHRVINGTVVNQKILSGPLKGYFAVQLGYSSATAKVNGKYMNKWFEDAGAQEDEPGFRTPNHFLDPISNEAIVVSYDPTAVWAQKAVGQQSPGDPYSWQDGREYFYTALISDIGATREENLAKSFRALGQVMHLVADMSVPEHTRDNSHIFIYTIEKWAEEAFNKQTQKPFFKNYTSRLNHALNNPVPPDPSLLQQVGKFVSPKGVSAPIPIANLYDSEQYKAGSTPDITTSGPIGLAEYTNANFFSRNTIFKDYDYPAKSSTEDYEEIDEESGKPMKFIRKIKDGELVDHLAQANVFHKYLPVFTNAYTIVNDKIYADYLEKLLPHAVGYAGALVDYFFRGTLTISVAPGDITCRSVKVTAQNSTAGEAMGSGEVALVIRYKALAETPLGGNRYLLNMPSADYNYKVFKLQNVNLATPQQLTFDLSTDPLPFNFSDMSMQLVYRGPLGNENDAVAVSRLELIDGIYADFALSLPPGGTYAKTAGSSFNELHVTALADIPGGYSGGTIELALEYRVATSDPFQSLPVDTEPSTGMAYIVKVPEKNGVTSLPQGVPIELVFDLSSAPLPTYATDLHLNVVYRETVTGSVTAVGYRDISEPTPVDIFNNTDYVCISNQWYPAGTPEARTAADLAGNQNGIDDDSIPSCITSQISTRKSLR